MRFWSSLTSRQPADASRDLIILGSSSSEALDYVIGKNPRYHPLWASGWSARGLRADAMQAYIAHILRELPRDSNVLLNFGVVDVLFTARFKAVNEGYYEFRQLLEEAMDGILLTRRKILRMGFAAVTPVFLIPVHSLDQSYWDKRGKGRQLPNRLLGHMYHDLFQAVRARTRTLDTFAELSRGKAGAYLLKPEFSRNYPDHHASYIKIHEVMAQKLAGDPTMLPPRDEPLTAPYPHLIRQIKQLLADQETRPNTCR